MKEILLTLFLSLSFNAFTCHEHYELDRVIELENWGELNSAIEKVLEAKKYTGNNIKFITEARENLASHLETTNPVNFELFHRQMTSDEYIYWRSLIRSKSQEKNQLVSIYSAGSGRKAQHLASFILKRTEQYAFYYTHQEGWDAFMYEAILFQQMKNYDESFKWRGFKKVYEYKLKSLTKDSIRGYLAQIQTQRRINLITLFSVLEAMPRGSRVLGLARVSADDYLTFQGYYEGIVKKDGVHQIKLLIEREEYFVKIQDIKSLQQAVY